MEREVSEPGVIASDYLQAFITDPVVLHWGAPNCSSALSVLFKYEVIIISKFNFWEGGGREEKEMAESEAKHDIAPLGIGKKRNP